MSDSDQFRAAERHGPIEEVFPEIFMVSGNMSMGRGFRIGRNMVILRQGTDLTLVNSVRLSSAGEAALEKLGEVKHLVRLGNYHGVDDAYFKHRYDATFWCQAGSDNTPEPPVDAFISADVSFPDPKAKVFTFEMTKKPEAALIIEQNSLLITCDSFQHYKSRRGFSIMAQIMMPIMGFGKGVIIGPLWLKAMTPEGGSLEDDFRRLVDLPFDTLISGHGQICKGTARNQAVAAVDKTFAATSKA